MNRASLRRSSRTRPGAEAARPRRHRLAAALAAALCALFAPALHAGPAPRQPGLTLSAEPKLVCPDTKRIVRLKLDGVPREVGGYQTFWSASAGVIGGDGLLGSWNLSGLPPGNYTATVEFTPLSPKAHFLSGKASVTVTVSECRQEPPPCPGFSLTCPKSVVEGEPAVFQADVKGQRTKGASLWTASAGALVRQDWRTARVETHGLGGKRIRVTFNAEGYGPECAASCLTAVGTRPTPTPSPTASPTPFVGGAVTPTPERPGATPSTSSPPSTTPRDPTAAATPVEGFFARNFWPVVLLAVLGLLAAVVTAALLKHTDRRSFEDGSWGLPPPDDSGEKEAAVGGEEGALVGGATRGAADELQCSVYAPLRAAPGDGLVVQAFAHLAEQAPLLAGLAREAQQNAERRGAKGLGAVERGRELTFHLQMPGLEVDEPSQSIVWEGEVEQVQFGVNVPADFRPRAVACKLTVSRESVPLGHIRFAFDVAAADAPRPAAAGDGDALRAHDRFVRYRQAFISYASEDRPEVLKRVQMLNLLEIKFFQDVLSLEPGQRWQDGLYRNIDRSDVLFLFWSRAASRSEWIEKEVRYALQLKAGDDEHPPEIVPVILQGPPEVPPPSYLPDLHFNDTFAFFIKAAAVMQLERSDK